ncbi:O-antigen ligase family protein [Winogradskyella sp.]|uniref:O-antigen ligase family protein n=1 Tax=Winogradskyella sp. TaxID=1883156 RepID=UPI001B225137|nr:O-antigen ligase family protein [Winogradskyella sp.]MBO6879932.1 O-antigen ligase family protein [Winogradskyella sp.]
MKNLQDIIPKAYFALMFFLTTSIFLSNVSLIILITVALFFGKRVYPLKQTLFSSLILLFFYVAILSTSTLNLEYKEYLKLLPLVLIPIGMAYIKKDTLLKGLYFLFAAILVNQIIALFGIIEYYFFTEGKTVALRSYAGINEILHFERPYLGFLSALNIIISYRIFRNFRKWVFVLSSVFSVLIIIIISARLGLIIALLAVFVFVLVEIKINLKYLLFFILALLTSTILFFQSNNPLKNRFQQLKYDTRIVVWQGAKSIYSKDANPIFGLSSQTEVKNKLLNYYKKEANFDYQPDKTRFIMKEYNTHNQYINELLRGGLLGLFLLISPFFMALRSSYLEKNIVNALLLLAVLLFLLVENLLARQMGVYSIAIILSLTRNKSYEST